MQEVDFRRQYLLLFCYCFATRGWSIWSKRNFPLGNLLYWNFHSYNLNRHGIFCHETHNVSSGIFFKGIFCHGIFYFTWNFLFPGIKIFSFMELMSTGIVFQGIFCHGIFFSWNSLFLGISYFHEIFKFMENLFHEICFHWIFFVEFSFL